MRSMSSEARFPLKIDWQRVRELPEHLVAGSLAVSLPPLVCFPLRSEWEALNEALSRVYPAPERSSRDGEAGNLPSAVEKLAQFASGAGWEVRAQESVGNVPHGATGRPTALKRLVALRFGAHPDTDRRAYVVYESPAERSVWKPRSIMIWGPDLSPYAHLGMNELRTYLRDVTWHNTKQINAWVKAIEKERQETEAFKKRRDTVRAQIRKVANEGRFRAAQQESRAEWFTIDAEWRAKVADLQDGVFTSEEVEAIIDPSRKRGASREGMA